MQLTIRLYEAVLEIRGKADELGPSVGAVWAKCDELEKGPLDDASFAKCAINQLIPILKVWLLLLQDAVSEVEEACKGEDPEDEFASSPSPLQAPCLELMKGPNTF